MYILCICTHIRTYILHIRTYIHIMVCTYIHMYVCMYVCMCIRLCYSQVIISINVFRSDLIWEEMT